MMFYVLRNREGSILATIFRFREDAEAAQTRMNKEQPNAGWSVAAAIETPDGLRVETETDR